MSPSTNQPSNPSAPRLVELQDTELGTLVGALRDQANNLGMQVLGIRIRGRRDDAEFTGRPLETSNMRGWPRQTRKLCALIHAFADTLLSEGYVVEGVDMRNGQPLQDWEVRVEVTR